MPNADEMLMRRYGSADDRYPRRSACGRYRGIEISAGSFDRAGAEAILQRGDTDLVAFGRSFTSNPDLPERLRLNLPLTPYRREAFWGGTEALYNDFPTYAGVLQSRS